MIKLNNNLSIHLFVASFLIITSIIFSIRFHLFLFQFFWHIIMAYISCKIII